MAEKIKVVGYARVSTSMQMDGKEFSSIEAQSAIIKRFVAQNPEIPGTSSTTTTLRN